MYFVYVVYIIHIFPLRGCIYLKNHHPPRSGGGGDGGSSSTTSTSQQQEQRIRHNNQQKKRGKIKIRTKREKIHHTIRDPYENETKKGRYRMKHTVSSGTDSVERGSGSQRQQSAVPAKKHRPRNIVQE